MSAIPSADAPAAIILAGGRSRRMGGGDKAEAALGTDSMIGGVIARLRPQVAALAISARGDPDRFRRYGCPVVSDQEGGPEGPLAGILAGFGWAAGLAPPPAWLATAPADAPFLPPDFVTRLLGGDDAPGSARIAASRGRLHPVCGLWPLALAPKLRAWLDGGSSLRVRDFVAAVPHAVIGFDDGPGGDPFFNVNTPDDLAAARGRIAAETAPK